MKIKLNNREEEFAGDKLTVEEIIALKSFAFKMLLVRLNDHPVKKEMYSSTFVSEGDDLKVIHLVSGG